jgi:hypothetical protein
MECWVDEEKEEYRRQKSEYRIKTDSLSPVSCILSSSFLIIPSFQFSIIPIRPEV